MKAEEISKVASAAHKVAHEVTAASGLKCIVVAYDSDGGFCFAGGTLNATWAAGLFARAMHVCSVGKEYIGKGANESGQD